MAVLFGQFALFLQFGSIKFVSAIHVAEGTPKPLESSKDT